MSLIQHTHTHTHTHTHNQKKKTLLINMTSKRKSTLKKLSSQSYAHAQGCQFEN